MYINVYKCITKRVSRLIGYLLQSVKGKSEKGQIWKGEEGRQGNSGDWKLGKKDESEKWKTGKGQFLKGKFWKITILKRKKLKRINSETDNSDKKCNSRKGNWNMSILESEVPKTDNYEKENL